MGGRYVVVCGFWWVHELKAEMENEESGITISLEDIEIQRMTRKGSWKMFNSFGVLLCG